MNDLRTAAQQALEALEGCVKALDALHAPGDSIYTRASDLADRAEIALRAALAQQEEQSDINWLKARPHVEDFIDHLGYDMTITNERVRFDAREKVDVLAQQEQEPVAWGWRYDSCGHAVVNRLAVTETPEPTVFLTNVFARGPFPLYTAPPRREWVSLTEEEINAVAAELGYAQLTPREVARAVEAALKERNT